MHIMCIYIYGHTHTHTHAHAHTHTPRTPQKHWNIFTCQHPLLHLINIKDKKKTKHNEFEEVPLNPKVDLLFAFLFFGGLVSWPPLKKAKVGLPKMLLFLLESRYPNFRGGLPPQPKTCHSKCWSACSFWCGGYVVSQEFEYTMNMAISMILGTTIANKWSWFRDLPFSKWFKHVQTLH